MEKRELVRSQSRVAKKLRRQMEKEDKNVFKEERDALKRLRREYRDRMGEIFEDVRWRDLFGDDRCLLIDVGAQGGLQTEWKRVTPLLRVIAFEPRPITKWGGRYLADGNLDVTILDANPDVTILNVGLDSVSGARELYVYESMSSFLRPDLDVLDQFNLKQLTPMGRSLVKTTTLDAVVSENRLRFVDFIKLDTQGTELDILRGGMVTVGEMAVGMRIEVSFSRLYESQPLFADVDVHVRSQGFDFIDLDHFKRRRHARTGAADKAALEVTDGQLLEADALYFRTPARLVGYLQTLAARDRIRYMAGALVACLTYSKLDLAARYIHEAGSLIEPRSSALMLELLRCAVPKEPINSG